jgi:hypothetical protein
VRSSSLLEDAQFQPFAGIYKTYMIPNDHPDPKERLEQLILAIKLVYASTYHKGPRSFVKTTFHRIEEEKMAVIIQKLTGRQRGPYFYPAISGLAQSYNFYPIFQMKPEEGIVHLALGLGKIVVEGGGVLRFSPKYPQFLPQFSTVEDTLNNSQRFFYALKLKEFPDNLAAYEDTPLVKLDTDTCADHPAVRWLSSYYHHEEHRIRDGAASDGYPVLTFANVLKYRALPLAGLLSRVLDIGRKGMGCPVEIEFAVNPPLQEGEKASFDVLQIRPMSLLQQTVEVEIQARDIERAFCYSTKALGNGQFEDISDIVYVTPERFDPAQTLRIAEEISSVNQDLAEQSRKYILIGPGRWGSADRWLGIPVRWNDISEVGVIVEARIDALKADPSQGSHFFHNIISLGISYLTTSNSGKDFIDWKWLGSLPAEKETNFLRHVRLAKPMTVKVNGKTSSAVIMAG